MNEAAAVDYPQLFRHMIVRSTNAALAAIDPQALKLEEEEIGRCMCALTNALHLPDAWQSAQQLILLISSHMRLQGYREEWLAYLDRGDQTAVSQGNTTLSARLKSEIGWLYKFTGNTDLANEYLQQAYDLARLDGDEEAQLVAMERLAAVAAESANWDLAVQYAQRVLTSCGEGDARRAHSCSVLGLVARQQGEWAASIRWYDEARHLNQCAGRIHFAAQMENEMAFTYTYLGNYSQAIEHYHHAIAVLGQLDKPLDMAVAQMGLGIACWYIQDYQQALDLFAGCEPIFVKTGGRYYLANLYNNRGLVFRDLGQADLAIAAFQSSIELMTKLNRQFDIANVMESLGGVYRRLGKLDEAIMVWQEAADKLGAVTGTQGYLYELLRQQIREAELRKGSPAEAGAPLS